jgi:haloacetate dehalogenase
MAHVRRIHFGTRGCGRDADQSAGRRISCPVLALWSKEGALDSWYTDAGGPLALWSLWGSNVTGRAIVGGHFFPEQNPVETIAEVRAFFTLR